MLKMFNKNKNDLIVRNNKIETIAVRDLKEYLVKDFEEIKNNEIEIKELNNRIDELEIIETKYKATLITLEEFDTRVEREKQKSRELEDKLNIKKEEIKQLNEEKNNCIIREKQAFYKINNVKDTIINEFKINLIKSIKNSKGTLSKKTICEIVEEVSNE